MRFNAEDSPDEWVRSVMEDGRAPADWLRLLTSADPDDCHRAKYKLGSLTPEDGHFFAALLDAARQPDWRVRFMALVALKRLGRFPPELVPVVREALHDPVQAVLETAIDISPLFAELDSVMTDRVAYLLASDPNPFVRRGAAQAVGAMVAKGAKVMPHVIGATADPDLFVRTRTAIAIKLLGPLGTLAAERMFELARADPDANIRNQASAALRAMGATLG
jgi:HEAT repeat protein